MKILVVSAGLIPKRGGGVPAYISDLLPALNETGAETFYLDTYGTRGHGKFSIRQIAPNRFEFFNSPTRLPFNNEPRQLPRTEYAANPPFTGPTLRFVQHINPTIIHYHETLCIPTGIIPKLSGLGFRQLLTTHDYSILCPTINLYHTSGRNCTFKGQELDCTQCIKAWTPAPVRPVSEIIAPFIKPIKPQFPRFTKILGKLSRLGDKLSLKLSHTAHFYRKRREFHIANINRLDRILCVSRFQRDRLLNYGIPDHLLHVLYPSRKHLKRSPNPRIIKSERPLRFIALNMAPPVKGLALLLNEFELARNYVPDIHLTVFGIDHPPPHDSVSFITRFPDGALRETLESFDIGIIPSLWHESYGMVGAEMLTYGLPLIGSRNGAIPEYLIDGHNGLLFDTETPGSLSSAIVKLSLNASLVAQFRANLNHPNPGILSFEQHLDALTTHYRYIVK